MRKNKHWRLVTILFPVLLLLGIVAVVTIPKGSLLKASEPDTHLVDILFEGEVVSKPIETEEKSAEFEMQAKEDGIYQIPYAENKLPVTYVTKDNAIPYYEVDADEFQLDGDNVTLLQISLPAATHEITDESESPIAETESSQGEEPVVNEPTLTSEITEEPGTDSPNIETHTESGIYKVKDTTDPSKGLLYLKLKTGDTVTLHADSLTVEDQTITLTDTKDGQRTQQLLKFKQPEKIEGTKSTGPPTIEDENKGNATKESSDSEKTAGKQQGQEGMNTKLEADILTDTTDTVQLKNPKLTIRTGEKNFDPDDAAGHDSSPTNDIVRTWDKVSYGYSFSVQSSNPAKTYKDIKYRVDATFKNSRQVVDGQVRDYAYFPEGTQTGNNAATTRDSSYSTIGTLANSSTIVDSVVNLQVLGATHNYVLTPEIKITVIEATDVDTGQVVPINATSGNLVTKPVRVSAKPNVKAEFSSAPSGYQEMSNMTGNESDNTIMQAVGMKFSVIPLDDKGIIRTGSLFEQLYGATYPKGEIEVNIDTSAVFKGSTNHNIIYGIDQKQPQITHYGLLTTGAAFLSKFTKTTEYNSTNFKEFNLYTPWTMPGSKDPSILKNNNENVFDSNSIQAENTSVSSMSYSVTNPAAIHNDNLVRFVSGTVKENINKTTFATVASMISIPYDYLLDKDGTLLTNFKTTTIKYEGETKTNNSSYSYQRGQTLPGAVMTFSPVSDIKGVKIGSNPAQSWTPAGDGAVYKNQKIWTTGIYDSQSVEMKYLTGITAWNTNSFQFDNSRKLGPYIPSTTTTGVVKNVYYGVKKDAKASPDLKVDFDNMDISYEWYKDYDEAITSGAIGAIKSIFEKTGLEASFKARTNIPLKAIGPENNQAQDNEGNSNIILSSIANQNKSMKNLYKYPTNAGLGNLYTPTQYNSNNVISKLHSPANVYGNTLLIVPFSARLTKQPIRTSYNSDELVQWKLTPQIEANDEDEVDFTIKDTLPKELTYVSGSTRYGTQEIEPSIKEETDGSTTLIWTIPYHKKNHPIKVLTFDTMVNGRKITYDATNTKNVTNKAVISAKNKDGLTDDTIEVLRSAEASTTITKVSTLFLAKSSSTSKIEIGTNDSSLSNGETNTTLKYSLYNKNEAKTPAMEPKIIDVLPNASDGRGTTFSGSYDLLSITATGDVKPKIYYTKQAMPSSTNPNDVDLSSGWSAYTGGRVTGVTAIYAAYDELGIGEETNLDISLVAKGQKVKDVLVNSAKLDNYNNSPVQSIFVKTTVIGRTLKGLAWYDDNLNGLKDGGEEITPNIPVKLYRTSQVNTSYKNELVKENLTGQKFIDASGNSLVKTDASGNYQFTNLPEGDYVAYFEISSEVTAKKFKVTKKDAAASSQAVGTSKVDLTTYKTDKYNTPTLDGGNFPDNEWKVENINLGLVRPGKIRLFKYSEGTAIDADKNGKLSDAEKATGTPLAGAVFDIYKGDQEEKIGTATTKSDGTIEFDKLFPGDYTLVETKAPSGHELLKKPIKVTVTQGNQLIPLYLADNQKSDLPFTGGQGLFGLLLMIAGGVTTLGFVGILVYYRPRKTKGGR